MNNYNLTVPVKLNIWTRENCQRRQLDIIRQVRPRELILISDGGRNDDERKKIADNRAMVEAGIDWGCRIHKLYEDNNIGVSKILRKTHKFIWEEVGADCCIFLEDDIIPHISFFGYCEELLERYKDDTRISVINGMNHLGVWSGVPSDYFFSRQGSIWGYALWRRFYDQFYDFGYQEDEYYKNLLFQRMRRNWVFQKKALDRIKSMEDIYSPDEFFIELSMYTQNQLQIIPKRNMICNVGATSTSANADDLRRLPKPIRNIFDMKTYETALPLKHPKYVIPDIEYEKKRNRVMAYNHPLVFAHRKFVRLLLALNEGDTSFIKKKISKRYRFD